MRDLTNAMTEPISVAGQRANVSDVVTIGVSDSALRLVHAQSATVTVEATRRRSNVTSLVFRSVA